MIFCLGINWYLTKNDESSDGKFTDYLDKDTESIIDPTVFNTLKKIVKEHERSQRTVKMVQESGIIPGALFYDQKLCACHSKPLERALDRFHWYNCSRLALENVDLIFADPDNGISYNKTSRRKGCEKYVLPEEIAQYYYSGKDVVYYCHKGRRTDNEWERAKTQILEYVCNARLFVLTFHRGTQRSYIFVVHPEHADQYETLLTEFLSSVSQVPRKTFTREETTERKTDSTPDICKRRAVLDYFQKAFRTEQEKEKALGRMTCEQIDELITACFTSQEKNFYESCKQRKTGFAGPTIGTLHPKGSKIIENSDGTITVL